MNGHLKPVFEKILPAFDEAGVYYWITGGVALAINNGKYLRYNRDVDVVVSNSDIKKITDVLRKLCEQNNWRLHITKLQQSARPKIDIFVDDKQIFSVIPVYFSGDRAKIIYKYENTIVLERNYFDQNKTDFIGYCLRTIPLPAVKELFKFHLQHIFSKCPGKAAAVTYMTDGRNMPELIAKYKIDAKYLFGDEDLLELVGF